MTDEQKTELEKIKKEEFVILTTNGRKHFVNLKNIACVERINDTEAMVHFVGGGHTLYITDDHDTVHDKIGYLGTVRQ